MNKRIEELLLKATSLNKNHERQWVFHNIDQKLFAQLIIEECMQVAWDNAYSAEHAEELRNAIESHFKEIK